MKLGNVIHQLEEAIPLKGYENYPKVLVTGSINQDISKIGFALDFMTFSLEQAKKKGCNLLLVHHGPPNYDPMESETTKIKIKWAKELGIAVYTLPLCYDASILGSNTNFTKLLKFDTEPIVINFQGMKLPNAVSKLKNRITHQELIKKLTTYNSAYIKIFGKPKRRYKKVVFAAGGGFQWQILEQTRPEVFISGDLNIRALRLATELGIILIELTHSSMENYPIAVAVKELRNTLDLPIVYIKEPEFDIRIIKGKTISGRMIK